MNVGPNPPIEASASLVCTRREVGERKHWCFIAKNHGSPGSRKWLDACLRLNELVMPELRRHDAEDGFVIPEARTSPAFGDGSL